MGNKQYMYERFGSKIAMCMGIMCPESKRNNCYWHKEWEKSRSSVGAYFGEDKCRHFNPMTDNDE